MSFIKTPNNPIYKRSLKKQQNIKLKKDIKANWGRFLDNHYDPNIHVRPFNAAMNVSKDSYKYSSAGLSHKFMHSNILQSYDVEDKLDRMKIEMRFKEVKEIAEGEIFVFIEYCSNNEKTQISTCHSEK